MKNILILLEDPGLKSAVLEQLGRKDGYAILTRNHIGNKDQNKQKKDIALIISDQDTTPQQCKTLFQAGARYLHIGPAFTVKKNLKSPDIIFALPLRLGDLLDKIDRITMRADATEILVSDWVLNPAEKLLTHRITDDWVHLTDKETELLIFLDAHRDAAVSRDTLLEQIWRYNEEVSTHTLETHIYRLRKKIDPEDEERSFLITEAGGYRLRQD